jgi:NAD(P)-dependent dehydrogenase (short-subunit alcohol dehydrogenase family)
LSERLGGRVAIVTGGSRGVGLGIARRLLQEGARVATCSRQKLDAAPAAEGIPGAEARSFHAQCDQKDWDQIDAFVARVVEAWGRLDILVNNAGGSPVSRLAEASPRFHQKVIETNLTGPLWFCLRAHQQMDRQEQGGAIVNISSQASTPAGSPTLAAYGAAKAGLNHLTKSLAKEWGPRVRVNCLSLGHVLTEMHAKYILPRDEEAQRKMFAAVPLRRASLPEEVGDACIFLCSREGEYINGATIPFDGGLA